MQRIKNLWRIYPKSFEAKIKLTTEGINIDGKNITIHNANPFATGAPIDHSGVQMARILLRDLPLSASNSVIQEFLERRFNIKLATELKYSFYRDKNSQLTDMYNGDRFAFVHPSYLKHPLPRYSQCGIWNFRIFHDEQFKDKGKLCYNCYSTEHYQSECKSVPLCRICRKPDHEPGDSLCDAYYANANVWPFGGAQDPLSNLYEETFEHDHIPIKSVEHGFGWKKAMANGQSDLAQDILNAPTSKTAKTVHINPYLIIWFTVQF